MAEIHRHHHPDNDHDHINEVCDGHEELRYEFRTFTESIDERFEALRQQIVTEFLEIIEKIKDIEEEGSEGESSSEGLEGEGEGGDGEVEVVE